MNELFSLGRRFERGVRLHDLIKEGIIGRIACDQFACGVITEVVGQCKGDHLEIGTLFGGTVILAVLAKRKGKVYVIDPLEGLCSLKKSIHIYSE